MRQVATQIENETQVGGNTAGRVGGLFNDLVDHIEDAENSLSETVQDVGDLNDEVFGTDIDTQTISPSVNRKNNGTQNTRWEIRWDKTLKNGDIINVSCDSTFQFLPLLVEDNNSTIVKQYRDSYESTPFNLVFEDEALNKNFKLLIKKTDDGNISASEIASYIHYSAVCQIPTGGLVTRVPILEENVNGLTGRVEAIEESITSSRIDIRPSDGTIYSGVGVDTQVTPNVFLSGSNFVSVLFPAVNGRKYFIETSASDKYGFGLIKNATPVVGDTIVYPTGESFHYVDNVAGRYEFDITEDGCYFFIRNDNRAGYRNFPIFYYINEDARFIERNELLNEVLPDSENPVKSGAIYEFARNSSKEIKILFIGNSLTQDAVMWLPYVLKNIGTGVKYQLIDMYNGGYTLTQQWAKINGGQTFDIASVCNNATGWTNYNNSKTLDSMLNVIDFDYLVLQEYYNYKASAEETDINAFNNIVDYIAARVSHPFEVVTLIHAPKRDNPTSIYNVTVQGNQKILRETCASSLINVGTAIYEALSTDLDSLGTQGHLSPDGTHAQEGLPCIMEALNLAMWVYKKLGIAGGVVNFQWTPLPSAIYSALNVAGANGSVIDGTTAQQLLASKVAANSFTKNEAVFVGANLA